MLDFCQQFIVVLVREYLRFFIKNMGIQSITFSDKERLEKVWESLQAAQKLQNDRLTFGIDHVNLYVEDVDGDWLERWGEEEDNDKRSLEAN